MRLIREYSDSLESKSVTQLIEDSMEDTGITRLIPMSVNFKSMRAQPENQHQLDKSMELIPDMKKKTKVMRE